MAYEFYEELRPLVEGALRGRLGKKLGSGAFSSVYQFQRDGFERSAVKLLRVIQEYGREEALPEAAREAYRRRLEEREGAYRQEIKGMYDLEGCPQVMPYKDYGFLSWSLEGPEPRFGCDMYIKMPLSRSLEDVLARRCRFSEEGVLRVGTCVCLALEACWRDPENILLHRDIKPANIFLARPESPSEGYLLGDFGVSRRWGGDLEELTLAQGTASYLAPEGRGPLVDIYSLGLTLYVLAAGGEHPFPGGVFRREDWRPLPPLVGLSPGLLRVLRKACAYDPQDRWQSPGDFLRALQTLPCREDQPDLLPLPEPAPEGQGDPDATAKARPRQVRVREEPVLDAVQFIRRKGYLEPGFPRDCQAAAEQRNDVWAQYLLGYCYDHGREIRNYAQALRWYRRACESHYPPAQYALGNCYFYGKGVDRDFGEAVKWYRLAAEAGDENAQYRLGECCQEGVGVPRDLDLAADWYVRAMRNGSRIACFRLGEMYGTAEKPATADLQRAISCCEEGRARGYRGMEELLTELWRKYWAVLAEGGDPDAARSLGDSLWEAGDRAGAVKWYLQAAPDPEVQCRLGLCFWKGLGVERDEAQAAAWYRQAAEAGHMESQYWLGMLYETGRGLPQDLEAAAAWLRRAAMQDHAAAQFAMGECLRLGRGVKRDLREARAWYQKSAENKWPAGQYRMGLIFYESASGKGKALGQAVRWFTLAAEQGHAPAQYRLGLCWLEGQGVRRDLDRGLMWVRRGAMGGDAEAQLFLADCYSEGRFVAKNGEMAEEWLRRAAEQGDREARYRLGVCLFRKTGDGFDPEEMGKWFRLAAEAGHPGAQYMMGRCCEHGWGCRKDPAGKARWYRLAAEGGDVNAQYALGCCYHFGYKPFRQDVVEAMKWLRLAAEQGDAAAQYMYGACLYNGVGAEADRAEGRRWLEKSAAQGDSTADYMLRHLDEESP